MTKKETLRMVTMMALIINVLGFVLTMKYGLEGFDQKFFIIWALAQVWIVLFTLANLFIKKSKKDTVKPQYTSEKFRMYKIK